MSDPAPTLAHMSEWWDQGEQWRTPNYATAPVDTSGPIWLGFKPQPGSMSMLDDSTQPPAPILYLRCTNCGHTESGTDHDAAVERSNAHVSACRS